MTKDFSILINLFAQDKIELEIILKVFKELASDEKRSELSWVRTYIEQSQPTKDTIVEAIKNMPIKRTMTPIMILETNDFKPALLKICELPENELENAITTLATLFRYSDTRRRKIFCKNGCNHEWHNIDQQHYNFSNSKENKSTNWLTKIKRYFV